MGRVTRIVLIRKKLLSSRPLLLYIVRDMRARSLDGNGDGFSFHTLYTIC